MIAYKILSAQTFSQTTRYFRIGSFVSTRTEGCYKLFLDYIPDNPESRLIVVPANSSDADTENENSDDDIMQNAWLPEPNQMTHRIYGYAKYTDENGKRVNRKRDRIGTVFSTRKEQVYALSLWCWPRQPDTDILAFELSTDDLLSNS
ncbi:MAG: hypothetical protein KTR32_37985 [Granulosicoccus sp.]|nr:hypothetical protein [Granulosicoccus sp.]